MNETLRGLWSRLTTKWMSYSATQRRNIAIALVAIIVALIAISWVVMRPNYVTIMSGLDNKSLGEVQTKLQDLKIPNEINGDSVLVPSQDANTARVQLAMAGLPQSGYIGYSSIQSSFGMTQDQFNIQVLDALQQSLNATIESIDGVESAQVHIVMPQQQVFVSQPENTAKASVFVQLGNGVQLTPAQVAGIQQLVAHSVTGLSANDVTVTDQNGNTLSNVGSNSPGGLASGSIASEVAMRQQLEQAETQQLTQGLNQIVGAGNAVVVVHANVTFNQVKTSSHVVAPVPGTSTGLPTSTQTTRSSSSSTTGGSGGPTGVSSTNPGLPTYAGSSSATGKSTSSNSSITTNYDNSYTNTQTVSDPMQVSGYTVGVFLNAGDKSLTPSVVKNIKSFVENAVGQASGTTSNTITVTPVPFSNVAPTFSTSASNVGLYSALAGGILAIIAAGWLVIARRRKKREEPGVPVSSFTAVVDDSLEHLPQSDDERMKDQLVNLASQKPDEFAKLLRTWLSE